MDYKLKTPKREAKQLLSIRNGFFAGRARGTAAESLGNLVRSCVNRCTLPDYHHGRKGPSSLQSSWIRILRIVVFRDKKSEVKTFEQQRALAGKCCVRDDPLPLIVSCGRNFFSREPSQEKVVDVFVVVVVNAVGGSDNVRKLM